MADVKRAKAEAMDEAVTGAVAIVFTSLLDKHGWTAEQLQDLWQDVNKLSEEIAEQRVKISDLLSVLRDEYEIEIK